MGEHAVKMCAELLKIDLEISKVYDNKETLKFNLGKR
jgi:hypothetical protein